MAEHKAMLWGKFVTTAPETAGCLGCEFNLRPQEGLCKGKDEEAAGFKRCDRANHIYVLAEPDKPTIGVDLATQPDQTVMTAISRQDNASSFEPPKHPHDAVIRAWLDGKTVQTRIRATDKWADLPPPPCPITFPKETDFRIKPTTKTLRYRVALMNDRELGGFGHYVAIVHGDMLFPEKFVSWLDDWREVEVETDS